MALSQYKLLRNYRVMRPRPFHSFNQRVYNSLKGKCRLPESISALNPALLPRYLEMSEKHDAAYHEALYKCILDIAERDLLQAQITIYLDEIAQLLETAALRDPEILLLSGFDVAKERRGSSRAKAVVIVSSTAEQPGQEG